MSNGTPPTGVSAAAAQLAVAAVFVLAALLTWVLEVPTGAADPHGYAVIFGTVFAAVIALPLVVVGLVTVALLLRGVRAGGIVLIVQSVIGALLGLSVTVGLPGGIGELVPSRWLIIALGVAMIAVSVWTTIVGVRVWRRHQG